MKPTPVYCPHCGGTKIITFMVEWDSRSKEDPGNDAVLDEHQCQDCDGQSFWT